MPVPFSLVSTLNSRKKAEPFLPYSFETFVSGVPESFVVTRGSSSNVNPFTSFSTDGSQSVELDAINEGSVVEISSDGKLVDLSQYSTISVNWKFLESGFEDLGGVELEVNGANDFANVRYKFHNNNESVGDTGTLNLDVSGLSEMAVIRVNSIFEIKEVDKQNFGAHCRVAFDYLRGS